MNSRSLWPLAVILVTGILAVTAMVLLKADAALIVTVGTIILITVPSTFLASQQGQTQATVQAVKDQTNGNTTALVQLVREQGQIIAQMHPPASGLTGIPQAPTPPPAAEPLPETPQGSP